MLVVRALPFFTLQRKAEILALLTGKRIARFWNGAKQLTLIPSRTSQALLPRLGFHVHGASHKQGPQRWVL